MVRKIAIVLSLILVVPSFRAGAAEQAKQPVFIHLFTRIDDHFNLDITEERIQRTLPLLEKFRGRHPQYGVSSVFQFTGISSEVLADRNRANGLRDKIADMARRGIVEVGYDGSEEPTWRTRPRPNFRNARSAADRWLARGEAADWFLTEYKHFMTGEPDPGRSGGLKKVQDVFGEAAFIAGFSDELGGDPEYSNQIRRWNKTAILPGLPEPGTWPARDLVGYGSATEGIGGLMSPDQDCAAELFWQDGFLRLSDTSGPPVKIVAAHAGPETLKELLGKLDRSTIHVIRVQLGQQGMHLKPDFEKTLASSTVRYAYDNPKAARLPEDALRSRQEIDAGYDREEALLRWLVEEYFPANPGSRFVSSSDLKRMAASSTGNELSHEKINKAAKNLLDRWKIIGNHPPDYARADGEYLSLADMFQLLTASLAEFHRTGKHPDTVRLIPVHGPIDLPDDQGPSLGSVKIAAIASACAGIAGRLNNQAWKPLPDNIIPSWIQVGDTRLNAAQFLRLMAEAYAAPGGTTELSIKTCQMFSGVGEVFPSSRPRPEKGAFWTIKPARLVRTK